MKKEELDIELYQKIIVASEIFLRSETNKNANIVEALDSFGEIVANEDLNKVSEIYLFEQGFSKTEKRLKNTLLHAITSVIAFEYSDENISYLEAIILAEEHEKGDFAVDFYLKIEAYNAKFKERVFEFIHQNKQSFSKNKLNTIAFYLVKVYGKEYKVDQLFKEVHELHQSKFPSEANPKQLKPWWKFW
jgi:hypothetical protein